MAKKKTTKMGDDSRAKLAGPTDEELLRSEQRRATAAAQERKRKKVLRALEKELETYHVRQGFLDALADAPEPRPSKIRKLKGQGKRLPAAAYIMLASDWHMGERVRPENVNFKNEYNPEIAQERAAQYWKSQLRMLASARAAWDIRQGVLWLGGDLMTGYIHEEYLEENFLSPVEESLLVAKTVEIGILELLANGDFEKLLIVTSNGNHGRTGQRIKIATYAKNSFEWLLYQFLAHMFRNEPRVKFQIGVGYTNVVDLYGFRIGFHHGDAIGYAGGIGGTTIPANRRIGRQAQGVPIRWEGTERGAPHLYVHGHFHHRLFGTAFIQNGSLIGYNDFAERIGCPYEDPMQTSFVIDERYKLVSHYNPILVQKAHK